jgi:anti-sigma factor RsiW
MSVRDIGEHELQAFVDGELPRDRTTVVLGHLGRHPEEIQRLACYARQKDELRRGIAAVNLPADDLTTLDLQRALAGRLTRRGRSGRWLGRAAAAALLVAAGWSGHGFYAAYLEHELPTLVAEAAQAHEVFGDDSQRPVELTAASQVEMRAWFSRHLGEEIEIPSLRAIGLRLVGGRLLPGEDSPVAQLIYEDSAKRRLTLCLSAEPGDGGPAVELVEVEGLTAGYWRHGEVGYALVAHTPDLQLVAIAAELGAEEPEDLL